MDEKRSRGVLRVAKRKRIHFLSPYLDGTYYGSIFTTLQQETNKRQSTLFTIQAVASVDNMTEFDYMIGTDVADGWLLMTNPNSQFPSSHRFLKAVELSGKPVVTIGYEEHAIPCHSVLIDNYEAMKEAVLHLIWEHGHRRIAFVGGSEHVDLAQRLEGYKAALQESGIKYEKQLYFHARNSLRHGGMDAAKEMLQRGVEFTAVVTATDLNAIGVIEVLQEAGYRVPADIAVIGFDDLPSAAAFDPPLTTVRQSTKQMAHASIDLLYRMMDGEEVQQRKTYIPTQFIPRASCGCEYRAKDDSIELVKEKLTQAEENMTRLLKTHNQLAANWASAAREQNFDFSKMFRGISRWGFLALWDTEAKERHSRLIIKQAFSKYDAPIPPLGLKLPIEQFPSDEWLPDIQEDEYVRVQAIRTDREDFGFIVLIVPFDDLVFISETDIARISCNITVAALVRDQLFNQVRSIAEQLEIVSRTTNDGIWDWHLATNEIHWSPRTYDMIHSIGEHLTNDLDSFLQLIHPDDYQFVTKSFENHLQEGRPLKLEFRIQDRTKQHQLWVYAAADSIRDSNGDIIRVIGSLTNITEKKKAESQITQLAYHDVLTGLPNRRLLQERFELCRSESRRGRFKLGVMLIDLDRFKIINDTLGHQVGDKLLKQVAKMLEDTVRNLDPAARTNRESSMVARLGGDEFIVLWTGVYDPSYLKHAADLINQRFQEPFIVDDLELYSTASIGISVYPDHGDDLDLLTSCADIAMYKAKDNGRNQNEMYNREINSLSFEKLSMENQLRRALDRGEFVLHYQPQIDLENDKIYGVEALVRWNSSERGFVSPGEFIPLAEESGLIVSIGRWILREACLQNKRWMDQGLPPTVVSVNISASQLAQNDFVEMVKSTLIETNLPPQWLCLEITESTAVKNMENTRSKLQELKNLGVHLAMDDFGTGYSSLSMLKHLPITNVKIDRSFVRDMVMNPEDAAIATAIITLARSLGMNVIAEGVETEDQKRLLKKERCHCVQGYIYSKPLSSQECLKYMRAYARK